MKELEEGAGLALDFDKLEKAVAGSKGILPVAIQHADTKEVLLIAYTNRRAFEESLRQGKVVLWSTSRQELWEKGKTSGNMYDLVEVRVNCEQNSLLYLARPAPGASGICHTRNAEGKARNCYYRRIDTKTMNLENLDP